MNWLQSDFIGPLRLDDKNAKLHWDKIDKVIKVLNALTPEQKNAVRHYGQDRYKTGLEEGWEDGRDFGGRDKDECY